MASWPTTNLLSVNYITADKNTYKCSSGDVDSLLWASILNFVREFPPKVQFFVLDNYHLYRLLLGGTRSTKFVSVKVETWR